MTNFNEYTFISSLTKTPEVWSAYTASDLWTDHYISEKMLEFHLDPKSEPASRPHSFIDESADWIAKRFDLKNGIEVADFGCGPGLYTSRFHNAGARVTGIDFSLRSIEYADKAARNENQRINYIQGDYLKVDIPGQFDLATMIYCDYSALSPAQRKSLLHKIHQLLRPQGKLLLDVFTLQGFSSRIADSEISQNLMNGFWAADEYIGIRKTWKYETEKVVLDKYDIFQNNRTKTIYNWLQYFSRESLQKEIEDSGFQIIEWYSNVVGNPFSDEADTMAVIMEKKR